jgi:uncharacterized protein (DUF2252 family)
MSAPARDLGSPDLLGRSLPSLDDRVAAGRAARRRAPRRELAHWDATARPRSPDVVLADAHAIRRPDLLPLRAGRMAASPWAYLRGAAGVMANDLATRPHTGIEVQLCGDAHILNFGLWATPERNLAFAVRDFDETLAGPFEWDVLRLAASVVVLARENGFDDDHGVRAVRAATRGYRDRMAAYADRSELDIWYDRIHQDALLDWLEPAERGPMAERIARRAERRTNEGAFERLTEVVDGLRRITEDPPRRQHIVRAEQHDLLRQIVSSYLESTAPHVHRLLDRFTFTDVVQQVVGVGSVGMRVFLVLAEGGSGRAPLFLQIKQAGPSVYEPILGSSPFAHHGQRVVAGQRLMQSAPDSFLGWTDVDGLHFYVRQLRDMKVIPSGDRIAGHLVEFASACGHALAKSHARSGDPLVIASYLGKGAAFDDGVAGFALAYAEQTRADHAALVAAVVSGEIEAVDG